MPLLITVGIKLKLLDWQRSRVETDPVVVFKRVVHGTRGDRECRQSSLCLCHVLNLCVCVCVCIYIYIYKYIIIYINIARNIREGEKKRRISIPSEHKYTYICIYIHTYIHTYIHIYINIECDYASDIWSWMLK